MLDIFSKDGILSLIISIPGLLLAISMHECAHGYAAYLMGLSYPRRRREGRLGCLAAKLGEMALERRIFRRLQSAGLWADSSKR